MAVTISDEIIGKCVPALSIDGSQKGGFSHTSIEATTKTEALNIFRNADGGDIIWRLVESLYKSDFMGKHCGQKINGPADFLKGRTRVMDPKRLTVEKVSSNRSRIFPYVMMQVDNPINNQTWRVTAGAAPATGETTPNTSESFDWKVIVTSSTSIPNDVRFFPPKGQVTIHGRSEAGVEQVPIYNVLDAELDGTDLVLYLDNISNNSADPFYANSATRRGNVVKGILTRGVPNVTKMESFCPENPALNGRQQKPFWLNWSRWAAIVDSEVTKLQKLIADNNPLYREFVHVDSVRAVAQAKDAYDAQMARSFLRNPALANQTVTTFDQLYKVPMYYGDGNSNTTSFAGYLDTYQASALGLSEQLIDCEDADGVPCYIDNLGEKLDLQTLKARLYQMLKTRSANGGDTKSVTIWVHSRFRELMVDAFVEYFKNKSQDTLRINMNIKDVEDAPLGFTVQKVKLDFPSVVLELASHQWLDDQIDEYTAKGVEDSDANFRMAGNFMLIPDWSSIYRVVFEAGKVIRKTGTTDDLAKSDAAFACVAGEVPTQTINHFFELWTTVVECPQASRLFVNFDDSEFLLAPAA